MTEHNIFQEIQEDLERQKLEALWGRYGPLVIAAAIAIVIGTAGITAWHSWRIDKNQQATAELMAALKPAAGDDTKQIDALQLFAKKNQGATQAVLAELHAAALAAQNGKQDQAVQIYDTIAKDNNADPAFRQLADLLSVRTQLDTGNTEELQKRLQVLQGDKAPWHFTAMEYSGYLALRAGDKEKAKKIFADLSQDAGVPQSLSTRAADMLRYVSE